MENESKSNLANLFKGERSKVGRVGHRGKRDIQRRAARIRFSSGMRRIETHAALLNPADCPEYGPLWVWHSYLKIKSRIQEVCSTKVLPLQSKRQTKIIYCQNFCFGDNLFKAVLKIKTLNAKDSQYIYFLAKTGRQQGIESCSNISNMTWDFFDREI